MYNPATQVQVSTECEFGFLFFKKKQNCCRGFPYRISFQKKGVAERAVKKEADECLAKLRHKEETKCAQQAKVKHVQEGGNNMKYFHMVANGKHRKKEIFNENKMRELYLETQSISVHN
jgi:hypothetical protein